MTPSAFICGCAGLEPSRAEEEFFTTANPWGLILFARNVDTPGQVAALVRRFRACVGRPQAPVFIDQEGGRVQRLRPPHWRAWPAARAYGDLAGSDPARALKAAWMITRLLGEELRACGINADCLPVLDLPAPDGHQIIGDRAYAEDPFLIAALARAAMEGLKAAGVAPVIKHIPGHGRARADSHEELPIVDAPLDELRRSDFVPFSMFADAPMAMTAHVVYAAIDADAPATLSRRVIGEIIRGEMAFDGLLMSDDVNMKALRGPLPERCAAAIEAGCDVVLHCSGDLDEMRQVAKVCGPLQGEAARRAGQAEACMNATGAPDWERREAEELLAALMAGRA